MLQMPFYRVNCVCTHGNDHEIHRDHNSHFTFCESSCYGDASFLQKVWRRERSASVEKHVQLARESTGGNFCFSSYLKFFRGRAFLYKAELPLCTEATPVGPASVRQPPGPGPSRPRSSARRRSPARRRSVVEDRPPLDRSPLAESPKFYVAAFL